MDIATLILISLSLSADAFAVSITNGMCYKRLMLRHALATALTFGVFQGLMPFLGFLLGQNFSNIITRYHHFVALFLLSAIGINMLIEVKKEKNSSEEDCPPNDITAKTLLLQGIATSIDALAAGVSFAAFRTNIGFASFLIGSITFICCFLGVCIGKKFGSLLGMKARLAGGVLLIFIGIHIFYEHIVS